MSAPLDYTPATRADLLPGAVFRVMNDHRRSLKRGALVRITEDDGSDCPFFSPNDQLDGTYTYHCFYLSDLAVHTPSAVAQPEPVTSHAVAAAEIARLLAEVAALREALRKIAKADVLIGALCMADETQAIASAAIAAQEQAP